MWPRPSTDLYRTVVSKSASLMKYEPKPKMAEAKVKDDVTDPSPAVVPISTNSLSRGIIEEIASRAREAIRVECRLSLERKLRDRGIISDKAQLVDDLDITIPEDSKPGRTSWYLAILGLALTAIAFITLVCLLTGSSVTTSRPSRLQSHRNFIFIVDINKNRESQPKLQALANCLAGNKRSDIYKIFINKNAEQPRNTVGLELLKRDFPNFHYAFQDQKDFFKDSIFANDSRSQPNKMLLLKAQLLTLWRYGGLVISPNWNPLKPLEDQIELYLGKDDNTLNGGSYNGQIVFLAAPKPCTARVFDMMKQINNVNVSSPTFESDVFDRVFVESNSGVRRFGYPYLCNNSTCSDECYFMKSEETKDTKPVMLRFAGHFQTPDEHRSGLPWMFKRFFYL